MDTVKVDGKRKDHQVFMYTISTCGFCKRTKQFMKDKDVEHEYIDVDKVSKEERDTIHKDIKNRGGRLAFPTIIIDNTMLITGFRPER